MNNRRDFLKNTALASAGAFLPLEILANLRTKVGANDKINVGLIGCKGQGWNNLTAFLKISEINCLALCDIDDSILNQRKADLAKAGINNPIIYKDYRKLLENKDIDFVIVATPDHWHCLQLTDALSAGKDVFCEKPIANSIGEARIMESAVKKSGKVVQVAQWQRSMKHFQDAVAFVQSGKLGDILTTKTWMYRGNSVPLPIVPNSTVPAGIDYKMWLGPAQMREFNQNRFHYEFRWFWDYAGGLMTDWGVHLIDIVLWAMGANTPKSVMAMGSKIAFPDDARETPDYLNVIYDYGKFTMSWENIMGITGGLYGRQHGIAFIGKNGTLVVNRGGWEVIPEKVNGKELMEAVPLTKASDNGLVKHTENYVSVLKSKDLTKLNCPIEAGVKVAINSHMGNVAYRVGEKIYYDESSEKFTSKNANKLIIPDYKNGWKMPVA